MSNRFNLIDEPWVPIANTHRISLRQIFTDPDCQELGGNPIQKIALTKLLLAIAQSAHTPKDDAACLKLTTNQIAADCLDYLNQWHDHFYLYGDRPFLQMPAIAAAKTQPLGAVLPEVASGNTTVLTEYHLPKPLDDADKALLLVTVMNFAFAGKKADNRIILTKGYSEKLNDKGKPSSSKPGVSLGFQGFLHTFLKGKNLWETLWLNLFTQEAIRGFRYYEGGLGKAPWEEMPEGEFCSVAKRLTRTLLGRLVPLSRFCLLRENELHYSEGILYPNDDHNVDPSMSINRSKSKPSVLCVDPEKRPWRCLTSLLSFMTQATQFECVQISKNFGRIREKTKEFSIWSGGIRVSYNAGEQYLTGGDNWVESCITLDSEWIGEAWYNSLHLEMDRLDKLSRIIYSAIRGFFEVFHDQSDISARGANIYWQLCEPLFLKFIQACSIENLEEKQDALHKLRTKVANIVYTIYDQMCPKSTPRQLDAWAKKRPKLGWYYLLGETA